MDRSSRRWYCLPWSICRIQWWTRRSCVSQILSVGSICSLLSSWSLLCSKISMENIRRWPHEDACLSKYQHLQDLQDDISLSLQGMFEPELVWNKEARAEKISFIVKYIQQQRGQHSFYFLKFLGCEFLNLINVIGQLFFMDKYVFKFV